MTDPRDAAGNHVPSSDTRQDEDDSDTIHVQRRSPQKLAHTRTASQASTAVSNSTATSTGFQAGPSRTSPFINGSAHQVVPTIPKRKRTPPVPERKLPSALQRLNVEAEEKGSAQNPIVLEEYSPRRHPRTLPQPRGLEEGPHKFAKTSRRQYANHLFRRPLASKTTNGSTFTGDIGNDIHRMRSAKFAAGGYGPQASPSVIGFGVPFDVQYPKLAQHIAQQEPSPTTATQHTSQELEHQAQPRTTSTSYVSRPKPVTFLPPLTPATSVPRQTSPSSMPPPAPSEDALRRKALQHIRDHSRPQLLKKPLPNDPDETSASESEYISLPSSAAPKRRKMTVYQDPNNHLRPLVAQSQVLTSLLQKYPGSKDKKGIREDIAMLVRVQNEKLETWMNVEGLGRKRAESRSGAGDIGKDADKGVREGNTREDDDGEVRGLLSAGAGLWQDGSGEGVADVYQSEGREEIA